MSCRNDQASLHMEKVNYRKKCIINRFNNRYLGFSFENGEYSFYSYTHSNTRNLIKIQNNKKLALMASSATFWGKNRSHGYRLKF